MGRILKILGGMLASWLGLMAMGWMFSMLKAFFIIGLIALAVFIIVVVLSKRRTAGLTGPGPAPGLAGLRRNLNAARLNGLDVRVSLVTTRYRPLPG